jgi:glycosyltransferase involved in cell wall biosynthesis
MAARLGDEGAARLVPPHDAVAAARALAQLLCDPAELARARRACAGVADAYRWPTLMAPLVERIESMYPTSTSAAKTLGIVYEAGGYYARRLADRVGPASA